MNRLDNWQTNLSEVIRARRERPFAWGTDDCTQFAFDAIKAVTGEDVGAPYRGKYKTANGALRVLKVAGFATPADFMASLFGEAKAAGFARKGDIVICDPDAVGLTLQEGASVFGPIVGVCYGNLSYFVTEIGAIAVETLRCQSCFHVLIRGASQ